MIFQKVKKGEELFLLDLCLISEWIQDKKIISIKYIEAALVIWGAESRITDSFAEKKASMILIEYLDGTQAFICDDPELKNRLSMDNIFCTPFPFSVEDTYKALRKVIPASKKERNYKYSDSFYYGNDVGERKAFGRNEDIEKMSDEALMRLRESCKIWESMCLQRKADKATRAKWMDRIKEVRAGLNSLEGKHDREKPELP